MDELIGRTLAGTYRIERVIGRGGMGAVYYGWDESLDRPVAVKVVDTQHRENPDYAVRFVREARAVAKWRHDNIVQVYYAGEEEGLLFFAMEHIEGEHLGAILQNYKDQGQYMPYAEVVRIIRAVAVALDYAHERGVIHRDVKPSNILIAAEDGRVVLTDFGLAMDVDLGSVGEIFGSPMYVAPEQAVLSAKAVPESDLYSLGAILFQMLTGELVFAADSMMATAMAHIQEPPRSPQVVRPEISAALAAVVLKTLEKEPQKRYASGRELVQALEQALADGGLAVEPMSVGRALPRTRTVPAEGAPLSVSRVLPPPPAAGTGAGAALPLADSSPSAVLKALAGQRRQGGGRLLFLERLASWSQDRWAGTAFTLLTIAFLAWVGIGGHPELTWAGRWFAPAAVVVLGVWLLYRRWWLLVGGEVLVGVALLAASLGWGQGIAWAALGACAVLLVAGLVYLARKGGAIGVLTQRLRELQMPQLHIPKVQLPKVQLPKPRTSPPPVMRTAEDLWAAEADGADVGNLQTQMPVAEFERYMQEEPPAPSGAPLGQGPIWSALSGWWPQARELGARLVWLHVSRGEVAAGLDGDPDVLEGLLKSGSRLWGNTVTRSEIASGYLVLNCQPQDSAAAAPIPAELRTMVPVGAVRADEQLWLCLAGRGHAVYVGEDTAPVASIRAALVALLVQMQERVRLAVCDPTFHLSGLRRAVAYYTTSKDEYRNWLLGRLYNEMMGRLTRAERGGLSDEPWWVLAIGDSAELEGALEIVLARGLEARIGLLSLVSPRSEDGQRLIRLAGATVCYRLRSEELSWTALGHAGAAQLEADQVLVSVESRSGSMRFPSAAVYVDDAVVAQVLPLVAPVPAAVAAPVPAAVAPAEGAPQLPADVQAVLEVVLTEGKFGVRSVYDALEGVVPRDTVLAIGQKLEERGIVGPARGRAGRALIAGMTLAQAAKRWGQAESAAAPEVALVPPADEPTLAPLEQLCSGCGRANSAREAYCQFCGKLFDAEETPPPVEQPPAPPAEIPDWLTTLLRQRRDEQG